MFIRALTLLSLSLSLLLTSTLTLGLESDANSEITIESDRAAFDRKAGTAVYVGNVILKQGSLLIEADKITLYSDEQQQLHKAIALGKPARFQQQMEESKGLTKARGQKITYRTQDKTVTLLDNAELEQEGNSFNGNQIIYDIVNESIKAKGGTNTSVPATSNSTPTNGRIKMIIQPAKSAEASQ